MQIQPITNQYQFQNKNNAQSFKGEFGKEILHGLSTSEGVHKDLIPGIIKIYGGFWKKFSASQLKDILETFVDRISSDANEIKRLNKKMNDLKASFSEKEDAMGILKADMSKQQQEFVKKQEEFNSQKQAFVTEKQAKEESIHNREDALDKRQDILDTKEKEFKEQAETRQKQLDAKERELKELEQKIINETRNNTTETIRKEEKTAALDELGEKYLALAKQEASLKEKEQALINAENILKEAEVEKIQSDLRAYYGISDKNKASYNNFAEQMVNVTQLLNTSGSDLKGVSVSTPENLIKLLQDDEGVITRDKIQFLERALETGKICDTQDLADVINIVIKGSDNLEDKDKAAHFITLLTMKNISFVAAIKSFASHYNIKTKYDSIKDGQIRDLVNKMLDDQSSCGLNAYGYRPNIETAEKLYQSFSNIKDLPLYSLDELNEAINNTKRLENGETHKTPAKNFREMISKLKTAIEVREQI